jgi:hypothetical protein
MPNLPTTSPTQEQEAWDFLASLWFEEPSDLDISLDKGFNKYTAKESKEFIKKLDKELKKKLDDWEITVKDMIILKAELFKQIQNVEGNGDLADPRKLIPMNVTLNVQNNY